MSAKRLDRAEKQKLQSDAMLLWCATYLWRKNHNEAAAELLKLVPREKAEEMMKEI